MRARECSHLLRTGHRCRCAALRNQPWCRHHAPKKAPAGPPPLRARDRYSRLSHWSDVGRTLAWIDPAEIPGEAYSILCALLEDGVGGISDRQAGRLLRGLLRRIGQVPFLPPGPPSVPTAPSQPAENQPAPIHLPNPATPAPVDFDQMLESILIQYPEARAALNAK